jgi:hypothetical protein
MCKVYINTHIYNLKYLKFLTKNFLIYVHIIEKDFKTLISFMIYESLIIL